jgi:hypothetical protein
MLFAQLCLLLLLLIAGSFVPGFFFVRRLRWTPLEKLCGSVGLSLALLYLLTWGIYVSGVRNQRAAYLLVGVTIGALAVIVRKDARRLLHTFRVRQAIAGYAVLLLGAFLMLGMIRVYSGGGWVLDWVEHFQRSLFFLYHLPPEQQVLYGDYTVPARPPMMNVLAAFFLGLAGERHELFQIVFAFLNALTFLSCFLLLPALGEGRRRYATPLIAILAASPIFMENVTYTWTKGLTVFYVVLAFALYISGLRKNDNVRIAAAFLALAPAILVHYSAGPYVLFLAVHYLVRFFRQRPVPWRTLAFIAITCSLFLATWFGWSLAVYGPGVTVSSNTAVTLSEPYRGRNMEKIGWNLYASIVPIRLRGDPVPFPRQPNAMGAMRDEAFMLYQNNLIFGMGLIGGPVVLWLLWRKRASRFWMAMALFCVVVGIAVVGERDVVGVPHLTLLSLEIIGLTFLAASFPSLKRPIRLLLILGCTIDFAFGVFAQARVQSYENTSARHVFGGIEVASGRLLTRAPGADALIGPVWNNWAAKHEYAAAQQYLSEMPKQHGSDPLFRASWPAIEAKFRSVEINDRNYWGGWFSRHDGVLAYLGDRVAGRSGLGSDIMAGLFALFFIAVALALALFQLKVTT